MTKLILKRIYDKELPAGYRVLVDRLWPRGMSKVRANLDLWAKQIAPTSELRKWFSHDPNKYAEFKEKYLTEIKDNPYTEEFLNDITAALKKQDVLILYSAKDEEHNDAVVLMEYLNSKI
ncbi:DUF488 domain-containing protein [Companilactobacillus halodurans]|uniref:DUF488 family protein n=1 Tax=Companilactobacillus halodurans TaxID=2584183 RepID=A0A5P1A024_9LACO|nr:DUF488 family protein [Companilactobacillus halodurans]MQS76660.1 DUF488 family protein [Companilactobacillus halodurans]MQS98294.1 DUF488 family protein [Companilactobacillus halodurans]